MGYGSSELPESPAPAPGTVIPPGGHVDFEVIYNFFKTTTVLPLFSSGDTVYTANLVVGPFAETSSTCSAGAGDSCSAGGQKISFKNGLAVSTPPPSLGDVVSAIPGRIESFITGQIKSGIASVLSGLFKALSGIQGNAPGQSSGLLGATTQGFLVTNVTNGPITLVGYGTSERPENGGPAVGTVIQSGQSVDFEVVYNFLQTTTVQPVFSSGSGGTIVTANLTVGPFNGASSTCGSAGGGSRCSADGKSLLLLNPAGSVTTIGPDQAGLQSQLLSTLCANGSKAQCSFQPTSQAITYTPVKQVAPPIENRGVNPLVRKLTITDTVTNTDSVSITSKLALSNLTKTVNFEISATYGHTWTNTHTFTTEITVTTPPGYTSTITAQAPIYEVTGNFTVVVDGTTFILTGVVFDTPDPDGQSKIVVADTPITLPNRVDDVTLLRADTAISGA